MARYVGQGRMMLVCLGVGIAAALAYLPVVSQPPGAGRSVLKTLPLTSFALAASLAGASPWLVSALALSAMGDLALSRDGRAAFLYGLAAFGLAHLLYVLTFLGTSHVPLWEAFGRAPLFAALLIFAALTTEVWLTPQTGALAWPVRGYVGVITVMGLAALTLPAGFVLAQIGAALFIASDLILAVVLFRLSASHALVRPASMLLWVLYVAGQCLILIAFAAP